MADTPVKGPLAFTASNGTTLVSYDPDFVQLNGGAGYVGITSNMLTMLFGDNTTDFTYREGTGTYNADQYVSATLNDTPAGGARAMFILRASGDTGANRDYYLIRLDGSTTVERWNNGSMTSLGTPSITWAAGDVAKFRAITNGANCDIVCVKNGTTQATISDTSPLSGGKPGIGLSMSSAGFMSLDSLELGDVTATSILSGGFDLADFVNSGAFATGALSQLSGGLTVDDFLHSGTLGLAPGRIDTAPFKNWGGTLLPGATIPNVVFLKLDRTLPLALVNQVTAGDGVMTITNAALVTGTYYIMVSYDATGANVGAELVLAA